MIITKLKGGLGNQLFQYAAGKKLAVCHNTALKLDISSYEKELKNDREYRLNNFNIEENLASETEVKKINNKFIKLSDLFKTEEKKTIINFRSYDFNENFLRLKSKNIYLDGYWPSEKYFKDIEGLLRQEFTLKAPWSEDAKGLASKINGAGSSISIHFRRGDYLNTKFSQFYQNLSIDYYKEAIKLIEKRVENPVFYIFSDDIRWVADNFDLKNAIFVGQKEKLDDFEELILMSYCQHNIIANSTFSWWGAWLNTSPEKIVISPKKWFKKPIFNEEDIIPPSWIRIDDAS